MTQSVAVIGDGAMGTTCAFILARKGFSVRLWGYDRAEIEEIRQHRENRRFLPGIRLPVSVDLTWDDEEILSGAYLAISAVPCVFVREIWTRLSKTVSGSLPILSVTKGIEFETLMRPSQIIEDVLGPRPLAVLSGPNIAEELAKSLPATSTVAGIDKSLTKMIQNAFSTNWLRIYTNTDVQGVELAGATKNVIAIAAGIIDGMAAGDNAKAALITRGLVEISRLGVALGARQETFAGLSGMGDLVTTCYSPKGRNRTFGQGIGNGMTVDQSRKTIPGQIEGINTCKSVMKLAAKHAVEMPITQAVYQILFENKPVEQAMTELMTRQLKAETPV